MIWRLFNTTDGIFATPWYYTVHADVEQDIRRLREIWKAQGYYKNGRGEHIAPDAVDLRVLEVDEEHIDSRVRRYLIEYCPKCKRELNDGKCEWCDEVIA